MPRSSFRLTRFLMVLVGGALLCAEFAGAQTITGSVRGQVTDPSGAVVPKATVQIRNTKTGVVSKTTTDSAGMYNFQFLPIGHYQLSAHATGFSTNEMSPFDLHIDQIVQLNIKLAIGHASTTVDVNAGSAPLLQTGSATVATTINAHTLATLPMEGLNFATATLFVPGAVTIHPGNMAGADSTLRDRDAEDSPDFNGNRAQDNNFILDGVEINQNIDNLILYNPAPASLQQIHVITANSDAEYGDGSGGVVIAVTKGGTNAFHGSAYYYFRNQALDAKTWSENFRDIPKTPFTQTQFGATFGGPILKNKLFFFADYEGYQHHSGGVGTASVPTAAMRNGDFSQLLTAKHIQLYDTQDGFKPYPNNQIPVVNPVAKFLFAHPELLPLPNHPAVDGVTEDNYVGYSKDHEYNNQYDIRVDYDPDSSNQLMGRFSSGYEFSFDSHPVLPIDFQRPTDGPFQSLVLNYVHVFGPSLVNQARTGYSRGNLADGNNIDTTGVFGLNGDKIIGLPFPNQTNPGFSEFGFSGHDISAFGAKGDNPINITNMIDYGDDLVWQHGKHTTKFGVEFLRYQNNYEENSLAGDLGEFSYSGQFTANPTDKGVSSPGFPFADFELDLAKSTEVGAASGLSGQRQWRGAYYVQDDWRVKPNLTLNLGVRYSYVQPHYEPHNRQVNVNIDDPSLGKAGLEFAGQDGNSRALYDPFYGGIMPRVGFAFNPTPRFVLRGGYGITDNVEGSGLSAQMTQNAPYVAIVSQSATAPSAKTPGTPLSVANGFNFSSGVTFKTTNYFVWDKHFRPAFLQQFNLTTQYELSPSMSLQVGYVGELGNHLLDWRYINQWPTPCTSKCTNAPFYKLVGQTGNLRVTESEAINNYNALQVSLRHRTMHGLEFVVNYTYSHGLTDAPGFYGVTSYDGPDLEPQTAYNLMDSYGPNVYDMRHYVSAEGVYELPFGHGRKFGAAWNGVENQALGGWSLSGSAIIHSGTPITIKSPNNANINNTQARANQYRPLRHVHRTAHDWFGTDPSATPCLGPDNGTCAYGAELPGTIGTDRVGSERAPGYQAIDLSVFKNFPIFKGQYIQFRTDAFNAFNIASLGFPNTVVNETTFGQITGTSSVERTFQLSLHYHF